MMLKLKESEWNGFFGEWNNFPNNSNNEFKYSLHLRESINSVYNIKPTSLAIVPGFFIITLKIGKLKMAFMSNFQYI